MSSRRLVQIALGVALVAGAGGCDDGKTQYQTPPSKMRKKGEPKFDWRDALHRPPSAARAALGAPDECRPDRQLPALAPKIQGFFEKDIRKCHYPDARKASSGRYYVDSILFSRDLATAVLLEPTEETDFGPEVLEHFHIPRLSVVRHRITDWEGDDRRVLSFRYGLIRSDIDRGTPIAVDLVAKPDRPKKLAFVRVGGISRWPYSIDHVQLAGRDAVAESLILPRMTAGRPLEHGMALSVELDVFTIRPQERYPLRVNGDDPEFETLEFDRGLLVGGETTDDEPWEVQAESQVRRWIRYRRELGEVPTPVPFNIYVTQTTPFEIVAAASAGLERGHESTFRTVGRLLQSYGAKYSRYARRRSAPLPFVAPKKAETAEESDAPPVTLEVGPKGFDLRVDGESVEASEDCPDDGPSLCLTGDEDVLEATERARKLQRQGKLGASDRRLEKAFGAYDWSGLYDRLSRVAATSEAAERTLHLRVQGDVPFAAAVRAAQLARHRVTLPDVDGCLETLPDETDFGDTTPCGIGGEIPATIFETVALVRPD